MAGLLIFMTEYKKRPILATHRRSLALANGCSPGESSACKCNLCENTGVIAWFNKKNGEPSGWVHFSKLEIDHVVAESRGGSGDISNLQLLCRACNRRKGAK